MRLVLCIHMGSTGQQESPGSRSSHCLCTWLTTGLRWDPPLSLSQDPTEPADLCLSTLSLQTEPNDPVPPTCFFVCIPLSASLSTHSFSQKPEDQLNCPLCTAVPFQSRDHTSTVSRMFLHHPHPSIRGPADA